MLAPLLDLERAKARRSVSSGTAGAWKTNVMHAFGNLATVTEPEPATGTTAANSPVTSYTDNGANQLVGVSMTRGGITQKPYLRL